MSTINLNFKLQSIISLIAVIVSGIAGIWMAYSRVHYYESVSAAQFKYTGYIGHSCTRKAVER